MHESPACLSNQLLSPCSHVLVRALPRSPEILCLHTSVVTSKTCRSLVPSLVPSRAGLATPRRPSQNEALRRHWQLVTPARVVCIGAISSITNHGLGTHRTGAGLRPAEQCRKLLRGSHLRVSGTAKILHAVSFQFAERRDSHVMCSFAILVWLPLSINVAMGRT